MNSVKFTFSLFILLLIIDTSMAQSGATGSRGAFLNYNNYVNGARSAGGDFEIATAGYLEIGSDGEMEIMGAVFNKGTIEVDSNGILRVYGDMFNDGTIILHPGAKVDFHGNTWKNTPTAKVIDGFTANTMPGGDLNFIGLRPAVPASWLVSSPVLAAYSGGNAKQYSDGGNVPMDVVLHLQNINSVELLNTPTRIEGKLQWDVSNGHLVLGNNDLNFTAAASQDGFRPDRYAITSGSGHVAKELFTGQWTFPVGKNTADYTPAAIDNVTLNTMHVSVMDYATSASIETTDISMADGMERTWNIYADNATGVSTINLQHNSASNQADFFTDHNFLTRWSKDENNNSGDEKSTTAWQKNNAGSSMAGDLSTTGVVSGAEMRNRTYRDFATSATAAEAFYTKSSAAFEVKPSAQILVFDADSIECETAINFTTGKESRVTKFQLQHSIDGKTFTTITTFDPKGDNSNYSFKHLTAVQGINYYRLAMLEASGAYSLSPVVSTVVNCTTEDPVTVLYPNPATDYINIAGLAGASEIRIIDLHGRVMAAVSTTQFIETIDIKGLPAATYIAQIMTGRKQKIVNIKFVKF